MTEKHDAMLVRDVAGCVQRVAATLASVPLATAYQVDPETRDIEAFRERAFGHAEMLEREARNI
ncbi:hypothetical protein [Roseibium sp. SCP14]|uniref:hypothetical protein n=1 Tax=Roseibium sp. SCP14 TaxID=3141375 RepID=UPI00333CAD06